LKRLNYQRDFANSMRGEEIDAEGEKPPTIKQDERPCFATTPMHFRQVRGYYKSIRVTLRENI
jgi:hypothetical protein